MLKIDVEIMHPAEQDIFQIMEIERNGFSKEEAANLNAMRARLRIINDTFLVARSKDSNDVVGFIVGPAIKDRYLKDKSYDEVVPNENAAKYQSVLSLAVHPLVQHYGIGTELLTAFAQLAKQARRKAITLTCLEDKISFYEKNGYQDEGLSDSQHANEKWHNMLLLLD
ncbi:N-acetyltransferase GCN5 [Liquorilactobacillus sucicola DSM 21376 = JCM 15457]|uniref:N-acetyltransferase GCN5 n=1 Tax=Liquorilactobacillus sucicola DSM 21376 = JCM 15457 TaxID=1423806 RepID=A0A0R2DV29_9LACO|nr:GNAT family N-acetyltransferase [Liquorilactobacillus sucicola]KRN05653.1 N-acetyltransferase GCN5 [Liquorilactobacillus sucicola DSM 21376 = JCM 15457]